VTEKVGFIGLGEMGKPMAKRILSHGHELTVFDVVPAAVDELVQSGAKAVGTPKEVAAASNTVITMVRDTAQSESVILGPNGVMEGANPGSTIIVMSSVLPSFVKKLAKLGKEKGVDVLDAAVTGAKMGAESGTLTIMAGGSPDLLERHRSVLETMGKIVHCGEVGNGQVVKITNNMALYNNLLACREAIEFGKKNGVSEDLLIEVMKQGTGNSWVVQNWQFTNPDGKIGPAHWGIPRKDLQMAKDVAGESGHAIPIIEAISQIVTDLENQS